MEATQRAYESDPHSAYTDALASEPFPSDRPRYAWVAEGEVSVGTLVDYVRCMEDAHYSGFFVGNILTDLTVQSGVVKTEQVHVLYSDLGWSRDNEGYPDHAYTRALVRDQHGKIIDAADYKIDLRA